MKNKAILLFSIDNFLKEWRLSYYMIYFNFYVLLDFFKKIVTPKKILERGFGVDRKFDFLNRCSDGRSETADAKISLKHDRFTIHMLDSEVGWIT
jgi:hypothetical protein